MTDVTDLRPEADEALVRLSTAPPPPPPARASSARAVLRNGWRQLTSMRTALVLLFLLALAAVPGSVLPQRGLNPIRVRQFFAQHPTLAPLLDKLSLFDVFAAPWFAAVYILLFVSLVGCLVPRIRLHARALRSPPPGAPRRLVRLPFHAHWQTALVPEDAVTAAAALLRSRRFRVTTRDDGDGSSLGAEKGYLRETGNLLFHLSLVALLVGVALGGLFGYKGTVLVKVGDGFANTRNSYDNFLPSRLFSDAELAPFSFALTRFAARYQPNGEPRDYHAVIDYRSRPDAPQRRYDVRVNHPLDVDGSKLYLIGHGYAPHFVVRDPEGEVAFDAAVPFLPQDGNFTSEGVVKVPDARPEQVGLSGFFVPTRGLSPRGIVSTYPAPRDPAVVLTAYHGDLGVDSGVPQSVYSLDFTRLAQYTGKDGRPLATVLRPGQTWRLPDGTAVTFAGVEQYATFQVTHDPGKMVALGAAVFIVVGLLLSLRVRRRRVWVRATPSDDGGAGRRTVVEVAGLARTDADDFAEEFAGLQRTLGEATVGRDTEPEE